MKFVSIAALLSIASVVVSDTLVVTQTHITTVLGGSDSSLTGAVATATATDTASADLSVVPTTLVSKTVSGLLTTTSSLQASSSGSDSSSFASAILDAHNAKRSLHSADDLEWDDTLYEYAYNYAQSYDCSSGTLTHSGGDYGENLALGYDTGVAALEAWYDEGDDYDYSLATTFDHFTQVIWKSTTKLGCAYKDCSADNWGLYVICSYDPAGNVVSEGLANLSSS